VSRVYNVVSPHLDDGALSCALFLAAHPGSSVITIFAGGPAPACPLTPWDKAARYFPEGADVMGVRRGEDISAAALVNATTHHLPYWDRQYRTGPYGYDGLPEEDLAPAIARDLTNRARERPAESWLIPLGLSHPDHLLAAEAGLMFAAGYPADVYLYEELPYAAEDPAGAEHRKKSITARGFVLAEDAALRIPHDRALKTAVVRCHASQRRALGRRLRTAVREPERIWRLVPAQDPPPPLPISNGGSGPGA
jgi:LmbE family N-acetylglucosaminyl deacetylase